MCEWTCALQPFSIWQLTADTVTFHAYLLNWQSIYTNMTRLIALPKKTHTVANKLTEVPDAAAAVLLACRQALIAVCSSNDAQSL